MSQKFEAIREFNPQDEYPIKEGEQVDFKTETYNQWVHDPVQNIGLNIWFAAGQNGGGRGLSKFMSTIIIFLDGKTWVGRSDGEVNHPEGVAAGNAFLTIVEPFKRLKIDYLGLLHHGALTEESRPADSVVEPQLARMDLAVDIVTPPIEQGSQGDRGDVASSGTVPRSAIRYEQLCRISGTIQIGSRTIEINALGMRSHRRNSASIYASGAVGHSWATALFPSGKGFHLLSYLVEAKADVGFLYGHYFDGERYHDAEVVRFPFYSGVKVEETSQLELRVDGKTILVDLETLPPLFSDIPPQGVRLTRSPASFRLDGELGGGLLERSLMPQFETGGEYRSDKG